VEQYTPGASPSG